MQNKPSRNFVLKHKMLFTILFFIIGSALIISAFLLSNPFIYLFATLGILLIYICYQLNYFEVSKKFASLKKNGKK